MHACVHDEIRSVITFNRVPHLGNVLLLDLHRRAETVRAANLLHRIRANSKQLVRRGEQDDRFRVANAARLYRLLACNLHYAPTGTSFENFMARLSIAAPISFISATSSTAPVLIASAGMPKITEDASSCAMT